MKKMFNKYLFFLYFLVFGFILETKSNTIEKEININDTNCCLCKKSSVVKYVLEMKERVSSVIYNVPENSKKILAKGIVKAEGVYENAKEAVNNGYNKIKDILSSIIAWAHYTQ